MIELVNHFSSIVGNRLNRSSTLGLEWIWDQRNINIYETLLGVESFTMIGEKFDWWSWNYTSLVIDILKITSQLFPYWTVGSKSKERSAERLQSSWFFGSKCSYYIYIIFKCNRQQVVLNYFVPAAKNNTWPNLLSNTQNGPAYIV